MMATINSKTPKGNSTRMLNDSANISMMNSQFSIIKGFGNESMAA
jgi:hypothetical protein